MLPVRKAGCCLLSYSAGTGATRPGLGEAGFTPRRPSVLGVAPGGAEPRRSGGYRRPGGARGAGTGTAGSRAPAPSVTRQPGLVGPAPGRGRVPWACLPHPGLPPLKRGPIQGSPRAAGRRSPSPGGCSRRPGQAHLGPGPAIPHPHPVTLLGPLLFSTPRSPSHTWLGLGVCDLK